MLVVSQEDRHMNSPFRAWAYKLAPGSLAGLFFGILTPIPWNAPPRAGSSRLQARICLRHYRRTDI